VYIVAPSINKYLFVTPSSSKTKAPAKRFAISNELPGFAVGVVVIPTAVS
jgi:hypothetical protein